MIRILRGSALCAWLAFSACDPTTDPVSPDRPVPAPLRVEAPLTATTYFDVTTLPGRLEATDLNNTGEVVGRLWNAEGTEVISDFHWSPGDPVVTPIPSGPLPFGASEPALNQSGVVVGTTAGCDQVIFEYCAYAWSPSSGRKDLYPLSDHRTSHASDVNDAGVVVGMSWLSEDFAGSGGSSATLWRLPAGSVEYVGPPLADPEVYPSRATSVNNAGVVVGFAASDDLSRVPFMWTASGGYQVMSDLLAALDAVASTLGGNVRDVTPFAINESGAVAGFWSLSGVGRRAFVWDPASGLTDLNALGLTGEAIARDINELGQAVLYVFGAPGTLDRWPWVWSAAEGLVPLPAPVPDASVALAINDRSQIAGRSLDLQSFLWTPLENAEDALDVLEDALDDVLTTSPAAGGQGLEAKLDRIREHLAAGRANAARNQLGAFLNQVAAMEADGRLSAADAARLRAAAEALQALLPGA